MKEISILCITRKYPPQIGGMENFSYNLLTELQKKDCIKTKIISLGKSQKNLIWFFPYTCIYVLLNVKKYDVLFVGDAVLCFLGIISKLVSPCTKRIINVFGLDITFANSIYQQYLKIFYQKSSDKYISISKGTDELLHQRWGGLDSVVITPGIPIKKDGLLPQKQNKLKEKYGIPQDHKVLLTVGRLVKRKGVGWFISNVMPTLEGRSISYVVIGDGKERESVKRAWEACSAKQQIHLLGRVEQNVLDEFYSTADIFVMPNIEVPGDKEGFGIVAAEASMEGLIVVASGIEGICDAIVDGKNGYLLPSEDAVAYRWKICELCDNWEEYEQKRRAFSNYTKEHYNWEFIGQQYIKVLESMV